MSGINPDSTMAPDEESVSAMEWKVGLNGIAVNAAPLQQVAQALQANCAAAD